MKLAVYEGHRVGVVDGDRIFDVTDAFAWRRTRLAADVTVLRSVQTGRQYPPH